MEKIETLRRKLCEVDRQILELVSRRQDLASRIGQVKQQAGIFPRDFEQEKEVVERARRQAQQLSVPEELATDLVELLIRHSLTRQEKQQVEYRAGGDGRRVLVIGGSGQMGRWFVRFLTSQGFEVEVADPAGPVSGHPYYADWKQAEGEFHITIVAAPLRDTAEILNEMSHNPPAGLLFDIGSLKSVLREPLKRLAEKGARVTSIHPMFGPDTELLSGRHVIFVDLGVPQATHEACQLFASTMAEQVEMDLENHDRLIAYVLGLSHALNIAFFTALAESGEAATRLAHLSSTTFDSQLSVAASVATENPNLYFEIQTLNDYGTESLAALLYAVERLRSVVLAGDERGFVSLMRRGREYLSTRKS